MKELEAIINRYQLPVFEVVYVTMPPQPIVYYSTCYGCGTPMLDDAEYCSDKCYCETACIDREDG